MYYSGDKHANTFHGTDEGNNASGLGGDDKLYGGANYDSLYGGTGADLLKGGDGDDVLDSETSDTYASDSKHLDPLAADKLYGGAGDDKFHAGYGDTIDGGDGYDALVLDLSGAKKGATIDFTTHHVANGGGTISGIEFVSVLIGTSHDDVIKLGTLAPSYFSDQSIISGMAGDDTIYGSAVQDYINGGGGSDKLHGGNGNDALTADNGESADGPDKLYGDAGNDNLTIHWNDSADGGSEDLHAWGDGDHVSLNLNNASAGVSMDLSELGRGGSIANGTGTIKNVEFFGYVIGSSFADNITLGNIRADSSQGWVYGADGDDQITGGVNSDHLAGDSGNDKIFGVDGDDQIEGGDGDDKLYGGLGRDELEGGAGKDKLYGDDGDDSLNGRAGDDTLKGGEGDDTIIDQIGHNTLYGGEGNDSLEAAAGSSLYGEDGDDRFYLPGSGSVYGGAGVDALSLNYYDARGGIVLDLSVLAGGATATVGGVKVTGVERYGSIDGTVADDVVTLGELGEDRTGYGLVNGNYGDDHLTGGAGTNTLQGDAGDDTLEGAGGNDVLDAGDGHDHLFGGDGNDSLTGHDGHDTLEGGAGDDIIRTTVYYGTSSFSSLSAGAGDDVIEAHWGDKIDGGSGRDRLYFEEGNFYDPIIFDYSKGSASVAGGIIKNIEEVGSLQLSHLNDVVVLGSLTMTQYATISGDYGDDRLTGSSGGDTFSGDAGADRLSGKNGDDSLDGGDANDRISGGDGNDVLIGGSGDDTIDGGKGSDTASFTDSQVGVTADLDIAARYDTGDGKDLFISIENVIGSGFDDRLSGNSGDNIITLAGGHDVVDGRGGTDTLAFTGLFDTYGAKVDLAAGTVKDIWGNQLADLASIENVRGENGSDAIAGNKHDNVLKGEGGQDFLSGGKGHDTLMGGEGNDTLDGGAGADRLEGGEGDDVYIVTTAKEDTIVEAKNAGTDRVESAISFTLAANFEDLTLTAAAKGHGNGADNHLMGSDGNDQLYGEDGADRLDGRGGIDTLSGGGGADTFAFSWLSQTEVDRVTDYHAAEGDSLDLIAFRYTPDGSLLTAIDYLGSDAFTGVAGQARLQLQNSDGLFMLDLDGDKTADLIVRLDGVTAPGDVHFLF